MLPFPATRAVRSARGLWRDHRWRPASPPATACLTTLPPAWPATRRSPARFIDEHASRVPSVQDALDLADLRGNRRARVPSWLVGNAISNEVTQTATMLKSSPTARTSAASTTSTACRLRRCNRLPAAVRFHWTAEGASYRMRRLSRIASRGPVNSRRFSESQFRQLIARVLHFVAERPTRDVDRREAQSHARQLYPQDAATHRAAARAPGRRSGRRDPGLGRRYGGVRGPPNRHQALVDSMAGRRRECALYLSHGDRGFSSILYHLGTEDFQLIDPRGAATVDELFSDRRIMSRSRHIPCSAA